MKVLHVLLDLATGATGITALEAVSPSTGLDWNSIAKLLTQIIIAVGTLISMFKRSTPQNPSTPNK